jgi:NAD-dependent deacetylase
MVIADLDIAARQLRQLIEAATSAVAFTGAGVSTESGVPDYRSKISPWTRHARSRSMLSWLIPRSASMRGGENSRWTIFIRAQPSRGHRALFGLVGCGRLDAIITPNIDGLHQGSGVGAGRLIELHGNGTYATCLTCAQRHELSEIRRAFENTSEAPQRL